MGTSTSWLILLQLSTVFVRGYDNVGFDGWYQPVPHRPVDIISDVINDLGVRILQQYTSHGNVAFSPTGVGFVLAALYEGSTGRGRQQIADVLGLPRDRDITRIGFRDIHRRLRTYLNANGFLGGLTLNQENTNLRPEYEDILRFYGFDISTPTEGPDEVTTPESTAATMTDQPVTEMQTSSPDEATTLTPVTQLVQGSENITEAGLSTTPQIELLETTMSTVNLQNRLTQTTPDSPVTMGVTTSVTPSSLPTTLPEASSISVASVTTASMPSGEPLTTTMTSVPPTMMVVSSTTRSANMEGATVTSTSPISTSRSPTMESSETSMSMDGGSQSTIFASQPSTTLTMSTTVESTIMDMSVTTVSASDTEALTSSTIPSSAQAKQMDVGSTNGPPTDENTVSVDASNNQVTSNEMGSTDSLNTTSATGETVSNGQSTTAVSSTTNDTMTRRKRSIRGFRGFFSSYPDEGIWMQDLGIWKPYSSSLSEASVRDSTEISFLVNGCDVSSVTASRYFAVLPFAYFPSLHAVAIEFPLDDPRYNILLLMSTDRRDTYRLARDLGGKSLRLLRKQLQTTWVRATIPSFMLRGFVTLTSFLQRLGIVDVFEPRAADLSLMTPDLGVYARDVQQSIGVNIRHYMQPDRTHSRESLKSDPPLLVPLRRDYYRYYHPGNGLFERAGPVPFTAVHPFLYFIVDVETSVALIAGRINDPLNSRIL
ncbi:uncharacterized protein LOC143183296 [Calliopsis andreniformis]|uniref:uncharacterized protein LOC143183296 n=1 Tax=Calliopsis andreniformis TaxID=337506 RepID=UPI003FCD57CD